MVIVDQILVKKKVTKCLEKGEKMLGKKVERMLGKKVEKMLEKKVEECLEKGGRMI